MGGFMLGLDIHEDGAIRFILYRMPEKVEIASGEVRRQCWTIENIQVDVSELHDGETTEGIADVLKYLARMTDLYL